MAEPLGRLLRPTGMRTHLWVMALVVAVATAACGTGPNRTGDRETTPSSSVASCRSTATPVPLVRADLDGDGTPDQVSFVAADGACPATLSASVRGVRARVPIAWDASHAASDAAAVQVPGRPGDLVLLRQQSLRGGFQAYLYGYAAGALGELTSAGQPLFPFVATDVLTDPFSARCVPGGFEVLRGTRHQPIGIVAAWDVHRTSYTVRGNTVTPGATTEVADNVLDRDLPRRFPALVQHVLFENCRVAG